MAHHCKNHPDAVARKRCSTCHSYICQDCQRPFLGRTFCSRACLLKALLAEWQILFQPGKKKAKKQSRWRSYVPLITKNVVPALLILFLILLWLQIHDLKQQIVALKPAPVITRNAPDTLANRSAVALHQPVDARVTRNTIDIIGEAADNIVVSVLVNGKVWAATISKDRRFAFEKIALEPGANDIIVRGLDEAGHLSILEKIITLDGHAAVTLSSAADFSRGNPMQRQVALTFDGGSGDGHAKAILEFLVQKQLCCTLFLTGAFIQHYPDLVKQILQQGHEIGNHTWSHLHLTTIEQNRRQETLPDMTKERLQDELRRTEQSFLQLTGQSMAKLWRAPFGEHNAQIRAWAAELGYQHVGWTFANGQSLDALDWIADKNEKGYYSSLRILDRLLSFGKASDQQADGGIILMHLDSERLEDPVYPIIPTLIDSLRSRGYQLVRVSEMMGG